MTSESSPAENDQRLADLAGSIFPEISASKEAAIAGLSNQSANVRQACVILLTKSFKTDEKTIKALAAIEGDENPIVRSSVRFALARFYRNNNDDAWKSKVCSIVLDDGMPDAARLHAYLELVRGHADAQREFHVLSEQLESATLANIDWALVKSIDQESK